MLCYAILYYTVLCYTSRLGALGEDHGRGGDAAGAGVVAGGGAEYGQFSN